MVRPLRLIRHVLVGLVVLVALVAGGIAGLIWWTLPGGDLESAIPGLSAPVDIDLDPDGVPRVRAANALDGAAALGFLHARERLFQMDLMRRAASGELSELAGPATLGIDRLMRTLGVRRSAEADLPGLPAETRAMLDAYARGVNAWIERRGRFASAEFLIAGRPRLWTPVDSLLWGKTMGLYLSGNWRTELARQALSARLTRAQIEALWPAVGGAGHPEARRDPDLAEAATRLAAVLPTFPDAFTLPDEASDEWAVDGAHSATGAPLLAGDPHLGFSLPGIWYLARIDTPDGTLAGATAPGIPFLVLGRNSRIAWTFTTTGADVQDLFVETPSGSDSYLTPDGPRPFATRTERIVVRGQPDETWTVRETRHGPVVSDLTNPGGRILALAMANLAPGDVAAAGLLSLNRAGSVVEAGVAAASISAPAQNLLVADRAGIGLYVTGRVPVRKAGDGAFPEAGADGAHDWIGLASGAQLPRIVAPASGRIVNGNERVAPPDFPVFLGRDWFGDWRARRIRELLDATPLHTAAEFASMQTDVVDLPARAFLPRLLATATPDARPQAALALLAQWDGRAVMDGPQPLIFNAWMLSFHRALLRVADIKSGASAAASPWYDLVQHALTPEGAALCGGGGCNGLLSMSLANAVDELAIRFGPDPAAWRWGSAHQAVFGHPILANLPVLGRLVAARIDSPGDDTTLDRGGPMPDTFESVHGASFRAAYDLADLDRSLFVVAPGQSGHLASRLARNFVQRWRDGATVTLAGHPDSVVTRIRLTP